MMSVHSQATTSPKENDNIPAAQPVKQHTFTLFEGLSATGLRSIRYAKEIPLLK